MATFECRKADPPTVVGDFTISDGWLYVVLPGMTSPDALRITRSASESAATPRLWLWDGNPDRPTLHPSISVPGTWHGWLRDGVLEGC